MIYKDYELIATNFNHPDIKTGMHTNGPAKIWIRLKDGKWLNTGETQFHKVRQAIDDAEFLTFIGQILNETPKTV